jgi:prepilin-type N-terminal cleavage/methylation domain-containing protein
MSNLHYRLHGAARRRGYLAALEQTRQVCAPCSGFTLVEIIIVIVIIAIVAMTAIPMMTAAASMQIRAAANMVAADLEYAKSMAISKGQSFSVVFDETNERYQIEDQGGSVVPHPVKKGFNYIVDFANDSRTNKVDIADADFDPDSSSIITFDYLGSPYSGSGTAKPLNGGVISLQAGNWGRTIAIEPVTGYITIAE